jgi:hypothetical protein
MRGFLDSERWRWRSELATLRAVTSSTYVLPEKKFMIAVKARKHHASYEEKYPN